MYVVLSYVNVTAVTASGQFSEITPTLNVYILVCTHAAIMCSESKGLKIKKITRVMRTGVVNKILVNYIYILCNYQQEQSKSNVELDII